MQALAVFWYRTEIIPDVLGLLEFWSVYFVHAGECAGLVSHAHDDGCIGASLDSGQHFRSTAPAVHFDATAAIVGRSCQCGMCYLHRVYE